jgi:hypothetical protein
VDAEVAGAFRDQSIFENFQRVKQHTDAVTNVIVQQPVKAPLPTLEQAQDRFLAERLLKLGVRRVSSTLVHVGGPSDQVRGRGVERPERLPPDLSASMTLHPLA